MSPVVISSPFGSSVGPFSPSSVAGLNLWLDAQDISTLWQDTGATTPVASDNDPVARWDDKSTRNFHHITNGAGSTRPIYKTSEGINGNETLRFDTASGHGLGVSATTDLNGATTVFVVFELQTLPTGQTYILWRIRNSTANQYGELLLTDAGGYQPYSFKGDYIGTIATGVGVADALDLNPHRARYTYDDGTNTSPSSYTFAIDGSASTVVASGNIASNGTDVMSVGSRVSSGQVPNAFTADAWIGEVLVYAGVLGGTDITNIENYLSNKWGI